MYPLALRTAPIRCAIVIICIFLGQDLSASSRHTHFVSGYSFLEPGAVAVRGEAMASSFAATTARNAPSHQESSDDCGPATASLCRT
jgi:hypothetical protein